MRMEPAPETQGLPMPRATKIVATLGPASSDPEVLERLQTLVEEGLLT